jgi:signal transduction histidine kinase
MLSFSVEGRLLRELGERLVKQPEVAFVELIKNAHDADATRCEILYDARRGISVTDNGHGMTLKEFTNGWMRIGTSAKESQRATRKFGRVVTGEKGIGRFAVRFLGTSLLLRTVADDPDRGARTVLEAKFDWPRFDRDADLGKVLVPFSLVAATEKDELGTIIRITKLRPPAKVVDLDAVRTASLSVVTPFHALLGRIKPPRQSDDLERDPGFNLNILPPPDAQDDGDVAKVVLDNSVLRVVATLKGQRLSLRVFRRDSTEAKLKISDAYPNSVGDMHADIRFFPQRKGTFANLSVKGPRAKSWVKKYSGVAVFDRNFRVLPYGAEGDDWLELAKDAVQNLRSPKSSLAKKHFPMDEPTQASTQLNYMLRLPHPQQLIGVVQVAGRRSKDEADDGGGLIAAADREGFVENAAFSQLRDIVRGAVEAIAAVDRELQQENERKEQRAELRLLRGQARAAIKQVERNPHIRPDDKRRIVAQLAAVESLAQKQDERARDMEGRLEVMSLLGIVAGFMTHEFGVALDVLEKARKNLAEVAKRDGAFKQAADSVSQHIVSLREFVTYTQGYIHGSNSIPTHPYPARPRIQQVIRVFGKYAEERAINVDLEIGSEVMAPLVPVSLYNGVCLNLYTNALKAVISKIGEGRRITFRAWNDERWHYLEVMDTGVGIPEALRERVFDPLFTTTESNRDPLGSGLGLGLTLVKRVVESQRGRVAVVDPPAGFATCVAVRLPIGGA